LKIEGNKSGRKILVEANNNGKVRGYVSIPEDDPILSGPGLFDDLFIEQDGQLTVVKDLRLKNLYESVVALTGEGLVADFDSYLNKSEQIPSVVEAGVILSETEPGVGKVVAAGGLLLQALPPYEPEPIIKLRDLVQERPPIEVILNNGQTPETILAALFNEFEYEILEVIPLAFRCSCSWERSEKALISLGREELVNLLETEGQAVVDCHFCHERYLFDADDLKQLIDMFDDPA
jgi:molecular chaperone Hsp33